MQVALERVLYSEKAGVLETRDTMELFLFCVTGACARVCVPVCV